MSQKDELGGNVNSIDVLTDTTEIVFCSVWGEKINTRGGKDKRLLVCREGSISLYKPRPFSKEPALSRKFSWFDLLKISHPNNDILDLSFEKGQIVFEHPSAKELAVLFIKQARDILTDPELPIISFEGDDPDKYIRNKQCPLRRFRSIMFSEGVELKNSYLKIYAEYIKSNTLTFDCTAFSHFNVVDKYVLQSLEVDNELEKIIVPPSENHSNWKHVAGLLAKSTKLKSIVTSEKFDDSAMELYNAFHSNKYSGLQELVFNNNEIRDSCVHILAKLVESISLNSLVLSNSCSRRVLKIFLTSIETAENFNLMRSITIDKISEMYILTSTQVCKNIPIVSFTNCETEIITFLKSLLKLVDCKIEKIDLSGNLCLTPVSKSARFPDSIKEVVMDNIKVIPKNIPAIFKAVHNSEHPIILHLSSLINTSGSLDEGLDELVYVTCPELSGLYWDSNPINGKFLKFIEALPALKLFSISGYANTDRSLTDLADYIATNDKLETLIIQGKPKQMPNDVALEMLSAISINRSITELDLSYQNLSTDFLTTLHEVLMKNRVIQKLSIVNPNIPYGDLEKFVSSFENRGVKLAIKVDMSPYSSSYQEDLQVLLKKIERGNPNIDIPMDSIRAMPSDRTPAYRSIVIEPQPKSLQSEPMSKNDNDLEQEEDEYSYYSQSDKKQQSEQELPTLLSPVFDAIPPPPPDNILEELKQRYSINEIIVRVRASDK